jgi:hypothetical protein
MVAFETQESNLSLIKPNSLFALTLDSYENTYENFQVQIISFGIVFAGLIVWLRYTYWNGDNPWLRFSKKLLDLVRPQITPERCLFGMWCLPTFKYAFDLDVLQYLH